MMNGTSILIRIAGVIIGRWVSRRIESIAHKYQPPDETLFNFPGNIVRHIINGISFPVVLNTFGVQSTSITAVIGAVGPVSLRHKGGHDVKRRYAQNA